VLERFLAGRDEDGELAFEVLVKRHGPMVRGVCRQVLDDPIDVHDAWQAVFLVLARRASAIRKRDSLGSWLHGVAVRVAARARATAVRRGIRDRRTADAARAQAMLLLGPSHVEPSATERRERDGVVHHEVSRLPEKFRAPIVLCYMEGLTHDQAAASLSWPVGTVRSRLSRGRDALRRRLARRGVAAPATMGPAGAWLAGDHGTGVVTADAISGNLAAEVVKLVSQTVAGRFIAGASGQLGSMSLADGVLKMLMLKKFSIVAAVIVSLATLTVGGGVALVRTSRAQDEKSKFNSIDTNKMYLLDAPYKAAEPIDLEQQFRQQLGLIAERYEQRVKLYTSGAITLDRFIEVCAQLDTMELKAARNAKQRQIVKQRVLKRLEGIESLGKKAVDHGLAPTADLAEIRLRRMQAEIDLKAPDNEQIDSSAILKRLKELERKVEQLEKRVPASLGGRM
jgi:RNA polymerase sigma factor (sigma-70 family)